MRHDLPWADCGIADIPIAPPPHGSTLVGGEEVFNMTERITAEPPRPAEESDLRQQAVKRLEERRGLTAHVFVYVSVNLLLLAVWYLTGAGFFWPLFPIVGWGIGLAFHAWNYRRPAAGEQQIAAEMERLRQRQP